MKILEFLHEQAIEVNLEARDKEGVIRELVNLLVRSGTIQNGDGLVKVLLEREALGSTGIGQGVGIPHGKSNGVGQLVGAFGISQQGVDFDSLDTEPAYIFFLLVAPEDSAGPHLKALARISRLLKDKYLRQALRTAKDPRAILEIIRREDEKRG